MPNVLCITSLLPGFAREGEGGMVGEREGREGREGGREGEGWREGGREGKCSHVNVIEEFLYADCNASCIRYHA